MNYNIHHVKYHSTGYSETTPVSFQHDYGQKLRFVGFDLPETFDVHFSNSQTDGKTITEHGEHNLVCIPNELLQDGRNVFGWIFVHPTEHSGRSIYEFKIPVIKRPRPF